MQTRPLQLLKWGLVEYNTALKGQLELARQRKAGEIPDTLLCLQHFPVITVGKRKTIHNVLLDPDELKQLGVDCVEVERGGDVTFHDPGQAILYPILLLRGLNLGVRRYVEGLEDVMIKTCKDFGVNAYGHVPGETGVWVEGKKIGAVGVQISSGVSLHGLAFNVSTDLNYFKHIVPCGLVDKEVTSLSRICGSEVVDVDAVEDKLVYNFKEIFSFS